MMGCYGELMPTSLEPLIASNLGLITGSSQWRMIEEEYKAVWKISAVVL
jgi:hypothetical protein